MVTRIALQILEVMQLRFYQATLKLLVHTDSTLDFFGLVNRKWHLNKMTLKNTYQKYYLTEK